MDQAQVEARLSQVPAPGQADPQQTRAALYGPMDAWCFRLGEWTFFLDPSQRLWYFLDPLHDEYCSTGFGPGQVRFVLQGSDWQAVPHHLAACHHCHQSLTEDSVFCSHCGQRV